MTETGETFEEQLTASLDEHYGQRVTYIGEDGNVLVLGHPGRRRSIAAANRLARKVSQLRNLVDEPGASILDIDTNEKWAMPAHSESCPLVEAFYKACSSDKPLPEGMRVVEPGDEIREDDACGCEKRGDDQWYIRYVPEGTPGAFPVTEVEAVGY